jgi:hypothetical protein
MVMSLNKNLELVKENIDYNTSKEKSKESKHNRRTKIVKTKT